MRTKMKHRILAVLLLLAREAGVPEKDVMEMWENTPLLLPLPKKPAELPAPRAPRAPRARVPTLVVAVPKEEEKKGLDLLFDQKPMKLKLPVMRHRCACGKVLQNRKTTMTCPVCKAQMVTTKPVPGGQGKRNGFITAQREMAVQVLPS